MTVPFEEIAEELERRVQRVVWCSASTVDTKGRTRVRVLHPVWDGQTAWIGTNSTAVIRRHLEANPHISLSYVDVSLDPPGTAQVYADCTAEWIDSLEEKRRVWDFMRSAPPPMGYDPVVAWPAPDHERFGLLKCSPWRIELSSLNAEGWKQAIWRA